MAGQPTPPIIVVPFAQAGTKNDIPVPSQIPITPGAASFTTGFPPLTMTPIAAGGIPPFGEDMNGILYMISSHTAFQQAGQAYKWNADVAIALTGYAVGTILARSDNSGFWMNIQDGNMTNPDGGAPAGWVPAFNYGHTAITGLTNANRTLTPLEASKPVIVLSGILSANIQVIFPNWLQSWLVINNCSGAFSVTAKTAAGAGVLVPQGGYANPTGVYGNGTSLFPQVAPVSLPIDVAATPDTIVKRSNVGYVYATYFNQNSSSSENPTVGAVFVENNAGDGFFRKIQLASLQAQMALANFAGQVTPGQVPLGAVLQYAAQILSSPVLTGVPTAPTAPPGTNTTQVATTAFVQGAVTPAANGSMNLPNGIIVKWGWAVGAGGPGLFTFAFPTPFPNNIFAAFMSTGFRLGQGSNAFNFVGAISTSTMSVVADQAQFGPNNGQRNCYYLAIGN